MTNAPVQPGDLLAGKYRVERVLGAGTMGVVVAATHVDLGQPVAVKFMRSAQHVAGDARERFLREARALVRLRSQHVARVFDVGALEDGAPYIVMEFLEGRDLAALLKGSGSLSIDDAVEYVLQTCEAVGEAHAAGIVHRDLKPANLFVTKDVSGSPCIKVLDFGISKVSGADLALTDDDETLGTPYYMSPEQMSSSKDVDARSDVWALGILLYELIAGQTPFHSKTLAEFYGRILAAQPTPLRERRSDVPPELDAVIQRCLTHDREQRWSDVAAFASALAPLAPARARGYPERVSRVLAMQRLSSSGPRLSSPGSKDELGARRVESFPPPASGRWSVLPRNSAASLDRNSRPTPASAAAAEAPAPLPQNSGAETALTLSPHRSTSSSFEVLRAKPRRRGLLFLASAFVVGAALAALVGRRHEGAPPPALAGSPAAAFGAPPPPDAAPPPPDAAPPPPDAAPSTPVEPQAPPSTIASHVASAKAQAEPTSPSATATAARKATKPPLQTKPPANGPPTPKPEPTFSYDERR
ncbi:serine/threonine-protein kinase [Sorangium sp. So ce1000]|uniref:serine/threonine-protein kinase n=1 Tax=Sorangium sp. So ce1000 TaxID=3133325 RepID=UPI003F600C1B